MSKIEIHKTYWVPENILNPSYASNKIGLDAPLVELIEYSAYQDLEKKLAKAREAIRELGESSVELYPSSLEKWSDNLLKEIGEG